MKEDNRLITGPVDLMYAALLFFTPLLGGVVTAMTVFQLFDVDYDKSKTHTEIAGWIVILHSIIWAWFVFGK